MAKVMVSIPDQLLERLDAKARERHLTRSGLLQTLAERELSKQDSQLKARVQKLVEPGRYGGSSTDAIRELRKSR